MLYRIIHIIRSSDDLQWLICTRKYLHVCNRNGILLITQISVSNNEKLFTFITYLIFFEFYLYFLLSNNNNNNRYNKYKTLFVTGMFQGSRNDVTIVFL